MSHVIGAKLDLVSFFCQAWRGGHNSGVRKEDIKRIKLASEFIGHGFDGLK